MEKLSMIGHVKDTQRVLKRAFDERFDYGKQFIETMAKRDFKKIFFLGSGTSHHSMLVIRNMFVNILGVEGVACQPTLFAYHEPANPNGMYTKDQILVIGLSQHGTSISTCEAMKKAKREGYYTIGITEELGSPITELTDETVRLVCEQEEIGPETRGYTESLFQFYILAIEAAKAKGILDEAQYNKLNEDAKSLMENFDTIVNESIAWFEKQKPGLLEMNKSSISGYGPNFPTALEARLKFFETYAKPCTGYEQEEQMHGPLRAYNANNYIFMIGSGGPELERLQALSRYYKEAFTKHVYVITSEDIETGEQDLKFSYKTTDILSPIIYVVPFQVLSALLCEAVGIDTKVSPVKNRSVSSHMKRG